MAEARPFWPGLDTPFLATEYTPTTFKKRQVF
jgi:hypothetical protein